MDTKLLINRESYLEVGRHVMKSTLVLSGEGGSGRALHPQ